MAYISVITDNENSLTKKFELGSDGKLLKSAPGHLVKGSIEAVDVNPEELIELIKGLSSNQCLCLGILENPGKHDLFCNKTAKKGQPVRSKEWLNFHYDNSYLLLDFDDSGKTPQQAMNVLAEVDPQFETCGAAIIPSSSSYIYSGNDEIVGEGNFHIFVELKGKRDPNEYGNLLFEKLLLNGFMNGKVTKAGSIVIQSLFDKVVLSPEREIFSANPTCVEPLRSERLKHALFQQGPPLNPDLLSEMNETDKMELRLRLKELRLGLQEEAEKKRAEYYVEQAKQRAKVNNTHYLKELPGILETPIFYDKQGRPIMELLSSEYIYDETGRLFRVRDLLLDPVEGMKLPDPIEPFKRGDESRGIVGKGVATVLGTMIYSHNHCGVIHLLRWTADDVMEVLQEGTVEDKLFLWRALSKDSQQLSSATTEAELSEIADIIKKELTRHKEARVGTEKRHIMAKIRVPDTPEEAEVDKVLEMNAKYGLVNMGGRATVVSEKWNPEAQHFETVFTIPSSLDIMTKNIHMRIPGVAQPVSLYKYWEQHPERKTFEDIVFLPNNHTFRKPGVNRVMQSAREYNLFQGYIYNPKTKGKCDKILNHIKEVWCSGIEEEYTYVVSWLAHMFQHPEKLSQTALVLQSVPGAGKGIIIENCIVKPLGIHAMTTSRTEDLVGKFNLHLSMNIFFFANEMEYTAQNSVKSMMKTLVETDTRNIEAKGVNKKQTRNCTSLIIATNGEWALNLDHDDRRYVYLTVSSKYVGNVAYFTDLFDEISNGGKDAFIKYLLNYDIRKYDYTKIPNRVQRQRVADFLRSAHPSVKFVWSLFDTDFGVNYLSDEPGYQILKDWQDRRTTEAVLSKSQFFSLFRAYCDYYKLERKYDDGSSIANHLEVGGILKRETDPREGFVLYRTKKDGKEVYALKSVEEGSKLLKV